MLTINDPHLGLWGIHLLYGSSHSPIDDITTIETKNHFPKSAVSSIVISLDELKEMLDLGVVIEKLDIDPGDHKVIDDIMHASVSLVNGPTIDDDPLLPFIVQGEYVMLNSNETAATYYARPCVILGISDGSGKVLFTHIDPGRSELEKPFEQMVQDLNSQEFDWSKAKVNLFGSTDMMTRFIADQSMQKLRTEVTKQTGAKLDESQFVIDLQPYIRSIVVSADGPNYYNVKNLKLDGEQHENRIKKLHKRASAGFKNKFFTRVSINDI